MLTDDEIAGMRETAQSALPQTAAINRATSVSDGAGGHTETWATLSTVPCRIAPAAARTTPGATDGGETGIQGGRIADEVTFVVTLPAATDITEADRVVIDGKTYEVTIVDERGVWEISRRVGVNELP